MITKGSLSAALSLIIHHLTYRIMWKLIQIKHSEDDIHAVYTDGENVCVHSYKFYPTGIEGHNKTENIPIEMPW